MDRKSHSERYKEAGVDITAGYAAVERMKKHVSRTQIPGVLSSLGGFGGLFEPDLTGMNAPVLVSGADGVGTKLRLAFLMDKHDTVGIDCVAMCVNDVVCAGARPLFFLDYIAAGRVTPSRIEAIVAGVAEGCVQAGCALIGGETAEMPGFYPEEEYDLAGFAVGMADKTRLLSPENAKPGDALIALPSSGPHSNGFSLIRRAFRLEENPNVLNEPCADLGETLGEALLKPTRIYVKPVLALLEAGCIHTLCHITGGGFYENVPRMLPEGVRARIQLSAIEVPPVFARIQQAGGVDEGDMYNTFNMGAGMLLSVPNDRAGEAMRLLRENGMEASFAGVLEAGERGVSLCR